MKDKEPITENTPVAPKEDTALATLYGGSMKNAGTEEVTSEDLKMPYLILLQKGTEIPELGASKKVGYYYRTDTNQQIESPEVNFVYITNEKRTDQKTKKTKEYKTYFGFYKDTNEPFKFRFKVGGWAMAAHKQLQTEISMYKQRLEVPMFALTVKLTSEDQSGITPDNEPYNVKKIMCEIVKDPNDPKKPLIEQDPDRVGFLFEAITRFKSIAPLSTDDVSEYEA